MSAFWISLCENLKHYGRNATIFFFALGGFFILLALAAIINSAELLPFIVPLLPGIGLFAAAWAWVALRRTRARQRERLPRQPLSRDELRVARSKLLKEKKTRT
jgi:hypothetical protein